QVELANDYKGFHVGDHLPAKLRWPVGRPQNLDNAIFVKKSLLVEVEEDEISCKAGDPFAKLQEQEGKKDQHDKEGVVSPAAATTTTNEAVEEETCSPTSLSTRRRGSLPLPSGFGRDHETSTSRRQSEVSEDAVASKRISTCSSSGTGLSDSKQDQSYIK
ncbi:unnamed protein product, partial [Amoebophrya sp. A25]